MENKNTETTTIDSWTLFKDIELRRIREERIQKKEDTGIAKLSRIMPLHKVLPFLLGATGDYKRARREFLDFEKTETFWKLPGMPKGFMGTRFLQLSDLHADVTKTFSRHLAGFIRKLLRNEKIDFCVITGDFQNHEWEAPDDAVEAVSRILEPIDAPIYAIPGNHDKLETLDALARRLPYMRMLINEVEEIHRNGDILYLCGVDDPHRYKTHDFDKVDGEGFRILLAHSPEIYKEAERYNFSLCLSGHTHGGQIRIGGKALALAGKYPRDVACGRWRHGKLFGYTSRGTGSCTVPMRLNCRPELAIHTLL